MDFKYLLPIDLNLFEGAAGGDGGGGTTGDGTGAEAPAGEPIVYTPRNKRASKMDNVVFGKEPEATPAEDPDAGDSTGQATDQEAPRDLQAEFDAMIKGDYKEQYSENVQKLINRRFKETKGMEATLSSHQPLLDMLASKYGVDAEDIDALTKAVSDDDTLWEQQAYDAGMTVQQYKQFKQLERENAELMRAQEARNGEAEAQRQLDEWGRQAMELQQKVPGFDLRVEAENPEFVQMLRAGLPVEHAYKVVHMDEILNGQAVNVAAQAQKQVVDNIRSRGSRPAENGTVSRSGFTYKSDVSKLSKEDRAEIARRAARGETIVSRD